MRIDKFLKVSRLIKRRTVAKEMADQERVLVNGRQVKSSYNVAINDIIAVSYTHLTLPTITVRCRSRWSPYH